MGKITKTANKVVVEISVEELIRQKGYIALPSTPPPKPGLRWYNYLGHIISNVAWMLTREKIPFEVKQVTVEGEGKVKVTFYSDIGNGVEK